MDILKSVDFELISLDESNLDHPVANMLSLVTLKLEYFTVFWVLYHCSIASKFL